MSPDASWVRLREGHVLAVGPSRAGSIECELDVEGERTRALAYPGLVGEPLVGDRVLVNTTARVLGLGTGGLDLVVAIEGRRPSDPPPEARGMKARYLPQQASVALVEETHADAEVEKVEDIQKIMAFEILMTPGLVINGEVRAAGRVPSIEEVKKMISAAEMA